VISAPPDWHLPLAQADADRRAARHEHDAGGGDRNPRDEGAGWGLPRQGDGFVEGRQVAQAQSRGIADEAMLWGCTSA